MAVVVVGGVRETRRVRSGSHKLGKRQRPVILLLLHTHSIFIPTFRPILVDIPSHNPIVMSFQSSDPIFRLLRRSPQFVAACVRLQYAKVGRGIRHVVVVKVLVVVYCGGAMIRSCAVASIGSVEQRNEPGLDGFGWAVFHEGGIVPWFGAVQGCQSSRDVTAMKGRLCLV